MVWVCSQYPAHPTLSRLHYAQSVGYWRRTRMYASMNSFPDSLLMRRDPLQSAPENGSSSSFTLEQAMELERKAHMADLEKKQRLEARRIQHGLPGPNEQLTQKERDARIWAFMYAATCSPHPFLLRDNK